MPFTSLQSTCRPARSTPAPCHGAQISPDTLALYGNVSRLGEGWVLSTSQYLLQRGHQFSSAVQRNHCSSFKGTVQLWLGSACSPGAIRCNLQVLWGCKERPEGDGTADPVQPHGCRKPCCPLCLAPFPLVVLPSCFIRIIFPPCSHRVVYVALVPVGPAQPCCFLSPPCCSEGRCCQMRIRHVPATQGRAMPEGTFGAVGCGGCAGVSHALWVYLRTRVPTGPQCCVPILSWSPWLKVSHTPLQPGSPLQDLAALHCQHALGSAPPPALRSRPPQHYCALIRAAGARGQPWEQCGWLCSSSPVQHRGSRVPGMGCLILHTERAALSPAPLPWGCVLAAGAAVDATLCCWLLPPGWDAGGRNPPARIHPHNV